MERSRGSNNRNLLECFTYRIAEWDEEAIDDDVIVFDGQCLRRGESKVFGETIMETLENAGESMEEREKALIVLLKERLFYGDKEVIMSQLAEKRLKEFINMIIS